MRLFSRSRPPDRARATTRRDKARPLAVMHIPKTSGVALIGGLTEAVRPNRVVAGFDLSLFGGFDHFDSIAPELRRLIYLDPAQVPGGAEAIAAHMAYSTLAASYPAAQLVTFLREPRTRLLSHYVYWRAQAPDEVSPWGAWAKVSMSARDTLERFLQRGDVAAQTDNLSLRMLLWPHPRIPRDGFIAPRDDAALLDEAMARLDRFAFADIIEHPALVAHLSSWCGQPVEYRKANETPAVPADVRTRLDHEMTAQAFELLHACSRLDARLWSALATRHMPAEAAARLAEATFARAIARYARLLAP